MPESEMQKYEGTYSQGRQQVEVRTEHGRLVAVTDTSREELIGVGERRFEARDPAGTTQAFVFVMGTTAAARICTGARAITGAGEQAVRLPVSLLSEGITTAFLPYPGGGAATLTALHRWTEMAGLRSHREANEEISRLIADLASRLRRRRTKPGRR